MVKHLPAMQETWVQSLGREDPLEKGMVTHSSILPGESHGQRSLAGHSKRSHKELETTEQLTLSCDVTSLKTMLSISQQKKIELESLPGSYVYNGHFSKH